MTGAERGLEGTPLPRRLASLVVSTVLGLGALTGCALFDDDVTGSSPATSAAPAPPGVVDELTRVLRRRAVGVREGREDRFRSSLQRRRGDFAAAQADYYRAMQQLPLGVFRYSFDAADILRVGESYWVVVRVHLQLEGYDAEPVVSRDRYLFAPDRRGRLRLASVTDAAWEERNGVLAQPWDQGPVEVRSVAGVLGVFDARSVAYADRLLESARSGITDVSLVVPYRWDNRVVLYAMSDTVFLDSLQQLPGGDPDRVDAVAFPVPADDADPGSGVAGVRVALHPRMLDRDELVRDRLVRHELVHVALGARDDDVPVWLSEGIAEWVSVRPLPPEQRALSTESLVAARDGLAAGGLDLPRSDGFNGPLSGARYGLSWWACEFLSRTYGDDVLWALVDQLGSDAGTMAQTRVDRRGELALESLTGLGSKELAEKAATLMVATYGP